VSAQAGWYPDPGGGPGLFRYWDGKAWSAATSPNPKAPAPAQTSAGAVGNAALPVSPTGSGQQGYGQQGYGQQASGQPASGPGAYALYQNVTQKKSPIGWWIGAGALLLAIVIVAVIVIRSLGGGGGLGGTTPTGGRASQDACPQAATETPPPKSRPNDGRVHGGPVSYPTLGSPWSAPEPDYRVPFGSDVLTQNVSVEPNYDEKNSSWVASVLVGELRAGDGFFTPEQGAQIVVKCILGKFYGENAVDSNVTVNQAMTIDGRDGWLVESKLSFDIKNLKTKGELLIVAIVASGSTAGLYYASIPDTTPELVQPARNTLKQLKVDG